MTQTSPASAPNAPVRRTTEEPSRSGLDHLDPKRFSLSFSRVKWSFDIVDKLTGLPVAGAALIASLQDGSEIELSTFEARSGERVARTKARVKTQPPPQIEKTWLLSGGRLFDPDKVSKIRVESKYHLPHAWSLETLKAHSRLSAELLPLKRYLPRHDPDGARALLLGQAPQACETGAAVTLSQAEGLQAALARAFTDDRRWYALWLDADSLFGAPDVDMAKVTLSFDRARAPGKTWEATCHLKRTGSVEIKALQRVPHLQLLIF